MRDNHDLSEDSRRAAREKIQNWTSGSSALVPFDEEEGPSSDPEEPQGQTQSTEDSRSNSRLLHLHSCKHANTCEHLLPLI